MLDGVKKILSLLHEQAKHFTRSQKVCAIVLDGVKVKEGLTYNIKTDLIDGFEDLAEYGSSTNNAQQAMVFMIKCVEYLNFHLLYLLT